MAAIFLDTSALVRRYDRSEPGARRVGSICRQSSGNVLLLARITPLEIASACHRKVREGSQSPAWRARLWRLFRGHWRDQYHALALDDETLALGQRLVARHPLRAYDALQLASALHATKLLARFKMDIIFCTADRQLLAAARSEGLQTELIA